MDQDNVPQEITYEEQILRVFKIKQAELGNKPPLHLDLKQVFEYDFICDINGPAKQRSKNFVHFSSYFKLQFRGENLLKGLVTNSLRVIDSNSHNHYVRIEANLVDSQLFITADFDLADERPNVTQLQIHFKIVLQGKLDLNLMQNQKVEVMQQAHCFEPYYRNGTPATVKELTHGEDPYEEDMSEDEFEELQRNFANRSQSLSQHVNNIMEPQVGGSDLNPQQPRDVVSELSSRMVQLQIETLHAVPPTAGAKLKPRYVDDNIMLRFEIPKLPSITAAVPKTSPAQHLLAQLRDKIFEERLHFPEINITNQTVETLRILYDNQEVGDQTFEDLIPENELGNIHIMALVWGDPVLNAQQNQPDPSFNENDLTMRERVVRRFMEQIIILMRNVDACLSNIRYDQASADRIRYNHAAQRTNDVLNAPDLGKLVKEMARVVRDLGMALSQLAHVCQKDEVYYGEDDPKIVRAKTIVQNVMDSMRYFAPAAQSLSRMVVPIESTERPRQLYVLNRPNQQQQQQQQE